MYLTLYAVALRVFLRSLQSTQPDQELSPWKLVTVAPMLVMIVGSFASLPLLLLVVGLGKLF
jgi:hypothetical protein